ncbi:hypothetical protein HYALB_00000801 [Hymenoscyphus albidus]|uniref:F-box domain-containing protein n=1 Tax=Hymenoscyphus albidus TaxID=595503 RepID=A0A9N9LT84_9HELO|nr:hypothetical protein HYALB_00000801 [Hymenoscyphus albidus]
MDDLPEKTICKTADESSQLPKNEDTATTEKTSSESTISENVQKPTLITLPEEVIELIIKQLHPVPSMCLALTARKFHRIHKAVHGKVSLNSRHENEFLSTLLVDCGETFPASMDQLATSSPSTVRRPSEEMSEARKDEPILVLRDFPEELLVQIMNELHPIHSVCLGLTARKFYRIHKEIHGQVTIRTNNSRVHIQQDHKIVTYLENGDGKLELSSLLEAWLTKQGFQWIILAQDRKSERTSKHLVWVLPGHYVADKIVQMWTGEIPEDEEIAYDGAKGYFINQVGIEHPNIFEFSIENM